MHQQEQLRNATFPSAQQLLMDEGSSASSTSNFNGGGGAVVSNNLSMPLLSTSPLPRRLSMVGFADTAAGDDCMPAPASSSDINNGLSIKNESNETNEATIPDAAGSSTAAAASNSSSAAQQHRNNLRSRVSIFLLMTPASRAMRRLFERRIKVAMLAKDPCNVALPLAASMPNIPTDMRAVNADWQTLSQVLTGQGRRNRFRQRKSISDIIRSASVSDLPYPPWLVPSGSSSNSNSNGEAASRLRFPSNEHKIIDPKQVSFPYNSATADAVKRCVWLTLIIH